MWTRSKTLLRQGQARRRRNWLDETAFWRQPESFSAGSKQVAPKKKPFADRAAGVGKTVLLNRIQKLAVAEQYRTVFVEAHENKPLGPLIAPHLRSLLFDLDQVAGAGDKVKRALRVMRSFLGTLKLTYNDVAIGLNIDPERGSADSGDPEVDLPNLFTAVAEAAEDRRSAVALLIDEIQYFNKKELGALVMAMHKIQQRQLPLVLLGAGLPILPGMAGESKSYAERLFGFPDVGALSKDDAAKALQEPAQAVAVAFEDAALDYIYELTKGYPYFIQEWGYQSWNSASASPISLQTVRGATTRVTERLDEGFFRVRFDRLTPGEKNFLRAMAQQGPGPYRTGAVAKALRVNVGHLGPMRSQLIEKGMIYSPGHGTLAFTVPLFDKFMTRAMSRTPS